MNLNPMTWDAPYLAIVGALFVIVFLRASATYWLGLLINRGAERTRASKMMSTPGYQRAVQQLNQWGPPILAASFLTIGFQTLVNLAAGAMRMPMTRYLPAVTVGSGLWAFLYGTAGTAGAEALGMVWERNPALAVVLGVVTVAALAFFIAWRVRESKRRRPEPVA